MKSSAILQWIILHTFFLLRYTNTTTFHCKITYECSRYIVGSLKWAKIWYTAGANGDSEMRHPVKHSKCVHIKEGPLPHQLADFCVNHVHQQVRSVSEGFILSDGGARPCPCVSSRCRCWVAAAARLGWQGGKVSSLCGRFDLITKPVSVVSSEWSSRTVIVLEGRGFCIFGLVVGDMLRRCVLILCAAEIITSVWEES